MHRFSLQKVKVTDLEEPGCWAKATNYATAFNNSFIVPPQLVLTFLRSVVNSINTAAMINIIIVYLEVNGCV
jgi:hypothetical protein